MFDYPTEQGVIQQPEPTYENSNGVPGFDAVYSKTCIYKLCTIILCVENIPGLQFSSPSQGPEHWGTEIEEDGTVIEYHITWCGGSDG